ncbi:MAG: head protein, partial [Gammaproteobacteria bacterium]|nr:head protein [Gammaproteobacteria bacterium]
MLINKASIQAAFVTLKATFNKAFEGAPSDWQKTAMLMPSTTKQNDYGWLSRFPKMRKWIGEKVVKALKAHSYTIVNDDFEATVAVDRNDIEDDLLGIYSPMAQDAGSSAKQLPDELVSELKDNAFAELCYDGQPFYDTDHPVGDTEVVSVSNKITAQLSSASLAEAKASYGALRLMIMELKDDEGRPLGLMGDTLEVPPA